jgi:hypothetical protein
VTLPDALLQRVRGYSGTTGQGAVSALRFWVEATLQVMDYDRAMSVACRERHSTPLLNALLKGGASRWN